jgi:sugar lactone lactonase YvrE
MGCFVTSPTTAAFFPAAQQLRRLAGGTSMISESAVQAMCRPVVDVRNSLGEGPAWDDLAQCLWWVDITGAKLHRLSPGTGRLDTWPMPERVSALALRRQGGLLVALASAFGFFDPATGVVERLPNPPGLRAGQRLNDGNCDPAGRFWCGGMQEDSEQADAALHCLHPDGSVTLQQEDLTTINCLNWSADGRIYYSDTPAGVIYARDFDADTGRMSERKIFRDGQGIPGGPDGGTFDAEGCLWSARYGGSGLARFRPDGSLDRFVPLPVKNITCCAFGGPDLRTLYVTSASEGLSEDDLAQQPWAGLLLAFEPGVEGTPARRFAG